jgi:hypothetical protein
MNERDSLIANLSSDLPKVKPIMHVNQLALTWLALSGVYVVSITYLFGPLRPTALHQLATEPRFLVETLFGLAAITVAVLVAFRGAVPGLLSRRLLVSGIIMLCLWIGFYLVGLVTPALEPSMLGKRPHCIVETFLFALGPLLAALLLGRRLYPLAPGRTAFWFGLVAGLLPALYMQLACMYLPSHILKFHILPGLLVAALAVPLGLLASRPGRLRRSVERYTD